MHYYIWKRDTPCEAETGTGGPIAVSVEHDESGDACVRRAPNAEVGAPLAPAAEPARNRRAAERREEASERNATQVKPVLCQN